MNHHIALVAFRLLLAALIGCALPISHDWFGEPYPGDGQSGLGFLILFAAIGVVAAGAFVVLASTVHLLLRTRPPHIVLSVDSALFLVLFLTLVYAGVTAKYGDA